MANAEIYIADAKSSVFVLGKIRKLNFEHRPRQSVGVTPVANVIDGVLIVTGDCAAAIVGKELAATGSCGATIVGDALVTFSYR